MMKKIGNRKTKSVMDDMLPTHFISLAEVHAGFFQNVDELDGRGLHFVDDLGDLADQIVVRHVSNDADNEANDGGDVACCSG